MQERVSGRAGRYRSIDDNELPSHVRLQEQLDSNTNTQYHEMDPRCHCFPIKNVQWSIRGLGTRSVVAVRV